MIQTQSLTEDRLLSREQARRVLGLSMGTLVRLIQSGELRARRIGRRSDGRAGRVMVPASAIQEFIREDRGQEK